MKITEVRACQPVAANSPPDWRTSMGQILVAIDTDVGVTGYGVGGGGLAGVHVVRTVLRNVLLGKSPEPIGELWQAMYQATLPFGRKGIAIMAVSGVDLALWDLAGKAARRPVARLLNETSALGPIPTYVTVWNDVPPELLGKYRAFKLHIGDQRDDTPAAEIVDGIAKARSVVGDECALMIDAWMKWNVAKTLTVAAAVQACRVDWLEEPLPPDDLTGYAELAERCPIPIAGGEHEFTAAAFAELARRRLHQVLQPDVCWCGGMTELVKIYALAKQAGLRVCPHRGAEVWGLHAIAALDPEPLAEAGRPWMSWLGGQPPIVNGYIQLSDAPGFGVVIDEDTLKTV